MTVALRKESVDRNAEDWLNAGSLSVALRKESVDRNDTMQIVIVVVHVALRKESVDRNITALASYSIIVKSLSARRAWIEIA